MCSKNQDSRDSRIKMTLKTPVRHGQDYTVQSTDQVRDISEEFTS